MPHTALSADDLRDDFVKLCGRHGCKENLKNGGSLLVALKCGDATDERKMFRIFITIKRLVDDPLNAEILLAALGLLEGYQNIQGLGARRRFYYKNGFTKGRYKRPEDSLRELEDEAIAQIAKQLAQGIDLSAFFIDEPNGLSLPTPQYYAKNKAKTDSHAEKTLFAQYIDSESQFFTPASKFDYRSDAFPFCFRDNELEQLDRFCADDRQVLWWAVVGSGGMGKSRLAYQFMLTRNSDEWRILFLRDEFFAQVGGGGKYQQFNDWSYPTNLMLIVDYAQRHSKAVAEWCESVVVKKAADGKKIRVLLLDRNGEDGLWYADFKERSRLDSARYGALLTLSSLNEAELFQLARSYAENTGTSIAEENVVKAIAMLPEIDNEKRILFFILLLSQMIEEKYKLISKTKNDLLDYAIKREIRVIADRFKGKERVIKTYMQLLILATVVGGLSATPREEWINEKCDQVYNAFPNKTTASGVTGVQNGRIEAMTPDLVGEYFVLTKYNEYFIADEDHRWFILCAWSRTYQGYNEGTADFLARSFTDFPISEYNEISDLYAQILSCAAKGVTDIRGLDLEMYYFNMPNLYNGICSLPYEKRQILFDAYRVLCDKYSSNFRLWHVYINILLNISYDVEGISDNWAVMEIKERLDNNEDERIRNIVKTYFTIGIRRPNGAPPDMKRATSIIMYLNGVKKN